VPFIDVSTADVAEFDVAIAVACMTQSKLRFEHKLPVGVRAKEYAVPDYFYRSDGCLVLSFDGGWYPFLDNTQGYNRGPQRWYVPKMSRLLARVAHAMQTPEQKRFSGGRPGGRVFLHSTGVVRRPASMKEIELLTWKLPKESCYLHDRHA